MGKRRKSRELLLQLLYQYEIRRESPGKILQEFWTTREKVHPDIRSFTDSLFRGTVKHQEELDSAISDLARNWKLSRLSIVDKNILRFAIFEIAFRDDIPEKVSIDEAIEVAKRYSSDEAGAFINGILDNLIRNRETFSKKLFPSPGKPVRMEDHG